MTTNERRDRISIREGLAGRRSAAHLRLVTSVLFLLTAAVGSAEAQQGVVAGVIVSAESLRPLPGAQVIVEGTGQGALANQNGQFRIEGLAGAEVTLRVVMLGFRTVTRSVRVGDTSVRIPLSESAIELNEIVVTGTVGATQRRALGNEVAQIRASDLVEVSPAMNMQQLVSGRVAGVVVLPGSGNVGSGSVTRIRGVSSLSLTNEPLIYVDGVRVNNDPAGGPNIRQGRQVNRLNDINPEDIESIEIIKGPAAATIYGTEASNGVIQIITKRGRAGSPSLDLSIRQGATWLMDPEGKVPTVYSIDPGSGQLLSVNLYRSELDAGRKVFQTGHNQTYTASLRGGTDLVRYYVSGEWGRDEGVVDYNWQNRFSTRANLNLIPNDRFDIEANLGYVQSETRFAQAAAGWGIWDQLVWGSPERLGTRTRGMLRATPEAAGEIDSRAEIARFTGSFKVSHNPLAWLSHRATFGVDNTQEDNQILFPRHPDGSGYFFGALSLGNKTIERNKATFYTLDYSATATYDWSERVGFTTSAGAQYYVKQFENVGGVGRFFPAPPVTTVSGAAQTFSSEDFIENKTMGLFVQEQIAINNRIFFTAAVRGDDNSAFGEEFEFVVYPKFSASWVVSEEPFWNVGWVNQLRLRSAWGRAGQQPDVFAAIRLYEPATGPGDAAVLTPQTIGNPDLSPEVGEELEVGFDAGLLDDRVSLGFTYYNQTTRDAIVQKPVAPSSGFPGSQFVNVAEIKNRGFELSVDGRLIESNRLGWDLGFTFGKNESEVASTGGLGVITLTDRQEHREGYPIGGYWIVNVVSADLDAERRAVNILCDGGPENDGRPVPCGEAPRVYMGTPTPTWEGAARTNLTLFENLRLFALVEFRGGHRISNGDIEAAHTSFRNSRTINERSDPIVVAMDQIGHRFPLGLYDAGFAKLREVSATYTVPQRVSGQFGASRATITMAARNLATLWRAQDDVFGHPIPDPEVRTPGTNLSGYVQTVLPPFSTFVTTVRLTF